MPPFTLVPEYTEAVPKASARTLVLRPADPFDLIRWLARSQSDPRKAIAELVQNTIDAHARHIVVEIQRPSGDVRQAPFKTRQGRYAEAR